MNKTKIFATLAVAAMSAVCYQNADAQLLYKVQKPGSEKTSYILGTHHFATLACVDQIAELPNALANADKLYGEIDMAVMNDPSIMMSMQQQMMAPADSTLDKIFTTAQLDSIGAVLNKYAGQEIPLAMMSMLKPTVISTQLGQLISAKVFPDLNPLEGIDATMQARARELGKPVAALETMQFQIDLIYNAPISQQAADLMETVRNPEKEEEMGLKLSHAYKAHDIDTILQLMKEEENEDAETIEKILYSRNENWVRQLSPEMADNALMVVVGAGHLPGERGVLEGLRKAGYTVTPVE